MRASWCHVSYGTSGEVKLNAGATVKVPVSWWAVLSTGLLSLAPVSTSGAVRKRSRTCDAVSGSSTDDADRQKTPSDFRKWIRSLELVPSSLANSYTRIVDTGPPALLLTRSPDESATGDAPRNPGHGPHPFGYLSAGSSYSVVSLRGASSLRSPAAGSDPSWRCLEARSVRRWRVVWWGQLPSLSTLGEAPGWSRSVP